MAISDNMRGALYMNVAMAAFTLNDTAMKAATQTVPLFEAIALRGLVTTIGLVLLGLAIGGLQFRLPAQDRQVVIIRSLAEIAGTVLFLMALMHMPLANLSAILQAEQVCPVVRPSASCFVWLARKHGGEVHFLGAHCIHLVADDRGDMLVRTPPKWQPGVPTWGRPSDVSCAH